MALAESVAASIAAKRIFLAIGVLLSTPRVFNVLLNRLEEDVFFAFYHVAQAHFGTPDKLP
jgi:hypothetical protein